MTIGPVDIELIRHPHKGAMIHRSRAERRSQPHEQPSVIVMSWLPAPDQEPTLDIPALQWDSAIVTHSLQLPAEDGYMMPHAAIKTARMLEMMGLDCMHLLGYRLEDALAQEHAWRMTRKRTDGVLCMMRTRVELVNAIRSAQSQIDGLSATVSKTTFGDVSGLFVEQIIALRAKA